MEEKPPSGRARTKRSKESSGEDENPGASSTKKLKTCDTSEVAAVKDKDRLKEEVFEEAPSSSAKKTLKRLSAALSKGSPDLSPSKKKKTARVQVQVDEDKDKGHGGKGEGDKKKRRTKNKALLKTVLEQMEFYLGDSNLSKDRWLRREYDNSEDGYIDLSAFLKFNKLQALHTDGVGVDILGKAIANSKLLEMNEDHTKVKRCKPLPELNQEDVDRRTVYVEHLPSHASHSWIKTIFSQCGNVCYVSLPVFPSSKEIKGFAFVEFTSAEEAEKACTMMNNPLPAKTEEKPGKFPKGNKTLFHLQKIAPPVKLEDPDSNEENIPSDSKEDQLPTPTKKKKKKNMALKKKNKGPPDNNSVPEQADSQEGNKKRKKKKRQGSVAEQGVGTEKADESLPHTRQNESIVKDEMINKGDSAACKEKDYDIEEKVDGGRINLEGKIDEKSVKKKRKKRKKKVDKTMIDPDDKVRLVTAEEMAESASSLKDKAEDKKSAEIANDEVKLSRKERKLQRQADIRRKKAENVFQTKEGTGEEIKPEPKSEPEKFVSMKEPEAQQEASRSVRTRLESVVSESSETDDSSKFRKSDGSPLTSCLAKSKKQVIVKKVEFDPVPETKEFIERKEIRRRKKAKRDSLHLRVLSKKDWLELRAEYINEQKSHMTALKESLRELRRQESANEIQEDGNNKKHVDLENVFGTKRMKPSEDVKLAHVEEIAFIPNVIVQWKCSHEINRNKIKTMFKEIDSDRIAYIEGKEEADSGYIRFKDEVSAEEFARLSRSSDSFSARVLPEAQQASYWEKINRDRKNKLSRKKNERGTDKIARKVLERNKIKFQEKGSHIVFDDDNKDDNSGHVGDNTKEHTEEPVERMETLSPGGRSKETAT